MQRDKNGLPWPAEENHQMQKFNYRTLLISGKQGSGKTTLQNEIAMTWQSRIKGGRAITVNFADVIYQMHDLCLNVLERYHYRGIKKDGKLLQLLGTEWGRKTIADNIWVSVLKNRINELILNNSHHANLLFIIGDCRFRNEFDGFPEALRIRLECPRDIRKERCPAWRDTETHPSEIDLDEYAKFSEGEQLSFMSFFKTNEKPKTKFDLTFHTDLDSINHCVEITMNELLAFNWLNSRKTNE